MPSDGDPFFREIQDVYDEIGEGVPDGHVWLGPGELPEQTGEIEASGLFGVTLVRHVDWETTYDADSYLALLDTFSGHIAMEEAKRAHLYAEIRRRLGQRPDGLLRRHWGAVLHVGGPTRLTAMRSWPAPDLPDLSVTGPEVVLQDTASNSLVAVMPEGPARLYACGITPYDATHMGHAATYVAWDLLVRAWRNAGREVTYVQNITDVDDPLLERATKVGVDWVGAGRARDRAVPAGHDGAAGRAAGGLRRGGRVDPARRSR